MWYIYSESEGTLETGEWVMKFGPWVWLVMALLLWGTPRGECAVTEVAVEPIGNMQIASGIQAELAKELEAAKAYPAIRSQLDLTSHAGDVWHYARLLVCREENKFGRMADMLAALPLDPVLSAFSGQIKDEVVKTLEENGMKVLDLEPVRSADIKGRKAVLLKCRLIALEQLPLPMYSEVYGFVAKGHFTAVVFLCPDSDRAFWQPQAAQMVQTLGR